LQKASFSWVAWRSPAYCSATHSLATRFLWEGDESASASMARVKALLHSNSISWLPSLRGRILLVAMNLAFIGSCVEAPISFKVLAPAGTMKTSRLRSRAETTLSGEANTIPNRVCFGRCHKPRLMCRNSPDDASRRSASETRLFSTPRWSEISCRVNTLPYGRWRICFKMSSITVIDHTISARTAFYSTTDKQPETIGRPIDFFGL